MERRQIDRAQRARDMDALDSLLETGDDAVPEAFADMHDRLVERDGLKLTPKQRRWVNQVANRLGIEPSEGPEDDELASDDVPSTRLTAGDIPRGREVAIACGPRPLRPPGRCA